MPALAALEELLVPLADVPLVPAVEPVLPVLPVAVLPVPVLPAPVLPDPVALVPEPVADDDEPLADPLVSFASVRMNPLPLPARDADVPDVPAVPLAVLPEPVPPAICVPLFKQPVATTCCPCRSLEDCAERSCWAPTLAAARLKAIIVPKRYVRFISVFSCPGDRKNSAVILVRMREGEAVFPVELRTCAYRAATSMKKLLT